MISRLGATNKDWTGQDMHAKSFACTRPSSCRPSGRRTAIDAFLILGPKINALKTRIASDHTFDVVTSVMGYGLDGDVVARIHLELRFLIVC